MTRFHLQHLFVPALLGALCLPALAGDITKPSGFNMETVELGGPLVDVLIDGSWLLATPGPSLTRRYPDGTQILFAEGFGSIDGVSQSTLSGDIAVGDYSGSEPVWLLRDLNDDGDALDPGERSAFPSALPLLSNGLPPLPFDVEYEPGTDTLFLIGATHFSSPPTLPAIARLAGTTGTVFFDDLASSGGLAFRDGVLYAGDANFSTFTRSVFSFQDQNRDGDAMDPGESGTYARGLAGVYQLAFSQDGSLWLSGGSSSVTFTGCVGRLLPDGDQDGTADGVQECVFEGFGFTSELHLFEGEGGFHPGADGDGELWIGDFGFDGNVIARSAPLAETEVVGSVGPDETVDVIVRGAPFADGIFVISLDTDGPTLPGIGDLCVGFSDLHAISPLMDLGADGEATCTMVFRELSALQGMPLVIQGFSLEDGVFGIGNGLDFVFGS